MNEGARSDLVHRTGEVLTAAVGEELLMMSVAAGKYFNLNDVGSRIWELLAQPVSVEGLVASLTAEYAVDADQARAEVQEFLSALRERGLLAPSGAPTA
ncbi:PqqD family peptide modification chaperone [Radicibacter daui]|uniref:PqqD family peptide modification chaperone n=1 Tax=Radicibacter daui TaxID=3064829 RepID=UPI004046894B